MGNVNSRELQQQYLQAMGVEVWLSRDASLSLNEANPDILDSGTVADDVLQSWGSLQSQVAQCTRCDLHRSRTQTVFGVGDKNADWLIIGEAPGAEEDRLGEPFVGRAGKLLNEMLLAIGLKREQVYIANILKCRPPNNRDPSPQEVSCCETYLQQQVELIQPRIIFTVGSVAAQNLLKTDTRIGEMRGRQYKYGAKDVPVVVSYHPAYLLRSPREKRKAWEDLKFAVSVYKQQSGV